MPSDLKGLKTQFLEYLEIEKGRSVKTVENYDRYLSRFLTQTKVKSPQQLTEQVVREFRLWLNRQRGNDGDMKKKTQNYYLIALRAFLKYLRRLNIQSLDPERIELAKVGGRDLDLMTANELDRLLKAPTGDTLSALRDRAILELFSQLDCACPSFARSIQISTSRATNFRYEARATKFVSSFSPLLPRRRSLNI